jgi:hypothetical protein
MTLGRGQVLTVTPSGQVTISGMPNTAKAHQMMARHGRNMAKGLIIWMDQNGRMGYSEPSYFRDVVGGHGGYN